MLTAEGCAGRRERLWKALPAECDFLIVGDPSHLIYFAGYAPSPFVFRTVESAALLLLEPGRATLVADDMVGPFVGAVVRRRAGRAGVVRRPALGSLPPWSARAVGPRPLGAVAGAKNRCRAGGRSSGSRRGPARGTSGARDRRYWALDPAIAPGERPGRDCCHAQVNSGGRSRTRHGACGGQTRHDRARRLPHR